MCSIIQKSSPGGACSTSPRAAVVAHDIDPLAVVAITLNADANGMAVEVSAVDLLQNDACFDYTDIDLVLAGDAFYDGSLADRATAFLRRCRHAGCTVLIGERRTAAPNSGQVRRICRAGRSRKPIYRSDDPRGPP